MLSIVLRIFFLGVGLNGSWTSGCGQSNSLVEKQGLTLVQGAIVRGDSTVRQLAVVFTGDEFADGGGTILHVLEKHRVKASFFFTGRFYRNPAFYSLIRQLRKARHYLGAHSDQHLLYCDWTKRDSLLIDQETFRSDLRRNYAAMRSFGINRHEAPYFLPPYEWYNNTIATWTKAEGFQLINYTVGTISHADYITPKSKNYRDSRAILQSIYTYEQSRSTGLNGFILLLHIGTHPDRFDKLYQHLDELLSYLLQKKYQLVRIESLLYQMK